MCKDDHRLARKMSQQSLSLLTIFFPSQLFSGGRRKLSTLTIYAEEDSSIDMSGLTSDVNDSSDKSKINVSPLPFISLLGFSFVVTPISNGDSESQ